MASKNSTNKSAAPPPRIDVVLVRKSLGGQDEKGQSDNVRGMLREAGVHVSQVHARCDKHDCVSQFKEPLPNMDRFESEYVAIPSGWWIGDDARKHIADTIRGGW